MLRVSDEAIRYRGAPGALDIDLLQKVLSDLRSAKPLVPWTPSGGVSRDQDTTAAWAKWYCDFQHQQFRRDPIDNCRLILQLLTDGPVLNLLFRYEPVRGEGSIGFRSFVWRTGADEYVCFEY